MTREIARQVRLAHMSDVHLPTPLPIPARRLLNKRILSLLSWQLSRRRRHLAICTQRLVDDIRAHAPDMILNTGDLTNLGDRMEFQAGKAWMQTLPEPVRFVPGNHDLLVRDTYANGLGLLAPWMEGQHTRFPYVTRLGHVAIIGVNSALPTPPFTAWGVVDDAQCARLHDALVATRGLFRIVMIHHPPRHGSVKARKALKNITTVADILRRGGAGLVLHGHSHDETLHLVEGTDIPLLGVSSASMRSDKTWRRASWNHLTVSEMDEGWTLEIAQRRLTPTGQIEDGLTFAQTIEKAAS